MFNLSIRLVWLIIAIFFGILEAMTLSLTMIWFSIGSLAAILVSYFTGNIFIQLLVFAVVSFSLLFFATKKLIRMDREHSKFWSGGETNFKAIINKKGYVQKEITPENPGLVKIGGEEWTAISVNGNETISTGMQVEVVDIQGVKLLVKKAM